MLITAPVAVITAPGVVGGEREEEGEDEPGCPGEEEEEEEEETVLEATEMTVVAEGDAAFAGAMIRLVSSAITLVE